MITIYAGKRSMKAVEGIFIHSANWPMKEEDEKHTNTNRKRRKLSYTTKERERTTELNRQLEVTSTLCDTVTARQLEL